MKSRECKRLARYSNKCEKNEAPQYPLRTFRVTYVQAARSRPKKRNSIAFYPTNGIKSTKNTACQFVPNAHIPIGMRACGTTPETLSPFFRSPRPSGPSGLALCKKATCFVTLHIEITCCWVNVCCANSRHCNKQCKRSSPFNANEKLCRTSTMNPALDASSCCVTICDI